MTKQAEKRIFDIILEGDEVTWQSLIQDLVRVENMDPWDIDISSLTVTYIGMLKKMQELNLRVSGKVVLAAAVLLKIKSNYLLDHEISNFDKLMNPEEYDEDALYEEDGKVKRIDIGDVKLIPKTPQPRKRKVSIYDLVDALKQALEVKRRRREVPIVEIRLPERKVDITKVIEELYANIEDILAGKNTVTFSQLATSKNKEDVVGLFLPMLHLSSQRKIDLDQKTHFGEIEITLADGKERESGSAVNADLEKDHDFVDDALNEANKKR